MIVIKFGSHIRLGQFLLNLEKILYNITVLSEKIFKIISCRVLCYENQ
jgi:hypothetical protein